MTTTIKRWPLLLLLLTAPVYATEGVPEKTISTSDAVVVPERLATGWKYIRCLSLSYFRLEATSAAAALEDNSGIKLPAGVLWPIKVSVNTRWIGIRSASGSSGCYVYSTDNPNPAPLSNISGTDIAPASVTTPGRVTAFDFRSAVDDSSCSFIAPTGSNALCLSGDDTAAISYGGGVIGASKSIDVGANDVLATNLTFNGGGTPCLTRGGNTTVQTCSGDSFSATAGLSVGGGATITAIPTASATINFGSISIANCADSSAITLSGAVAGSPLALQVPNAAMVTGSQFQAWVNTTGQVTVRHCCNGSATCDPGSGDFYVRAFAP